MNSIRELLGPTANMADIRSPGPSYAEWHRFLDECEEAGLASTIGTERGIDTGRLGSPLGFALLRRWRWLKDSEERNIPYEVAEAAFTAAMDRDHDALVEHAHAQDRRRAAAIREKQSAETVAKNARKFFDEAMADAHR